MKLIFINSVDKKEYEFSVTDLEDSKLYYHFNNFELPNDIDDGQYDYFLYDSEDELVAQGLVQIGTYESDHKVYSKEPKQTYKQYQG